MEKHFRKQEDWKREIGLYTMLSGKLPVLTVLHAAPGVLVTRYQKGVTLLDSLNRQKESGFDAAPWLALCDWLSACHAACGLLPTDHNLRNFFWDEQAEVVIGLDLEYLFPWDLPSCGAHFIAFVRGYTQDNLFLQESVTKLLMQNLHVKAEDIAVAVERFQKINKKQSDRPFSGIILPSTNGCKEQLQFNGKSLLQWQKDKFALMGCEEILIPTEMCCTHFHLGMLGGLYDCLMAARQECCLMVPEDAPLVPPAALAHLCREHKEGITVLRYAGKEEALIAVCDRTAASSIARFLSSEGKSFTELKQMVPWNAFDYLGPEGFLQRCSTQEDCDKLAAFSAEYQNAGISLC